jgi:hypothetical protein
MPVATGSVSAVSGWCPVVSGNDNSNNDNDDSHSNDSKNPAASRYCEREGPAAAGAANR